MGIEIITDNENGIKNLKSVLYNILYVMTITKLDHKVVVRHGFKTSVK